LAISMPSNCLSRSVVRSISLMLASTLEMSLKVGISISGELVR
jgi:hypothetical protein